MNVDLLAASSVFVPFLGFLWGLGFFCVCVYVQGCASECCQFSYIDKPTRIKKTMFQTIET